MWHVVPNSSFLFEPKELRYLKQLLAKNVCNCKICSSYEKSLIKDYHDKQIQVTDQSFYNKIPRTASDLEVHLTPSHTYKSHMCPGCYMAINLTRQKDFKILKDEESETRTEMFCCDKSTGKAFKVADKSTSDTNKCQLNNANLSLSQVTPGGSNSKIEKANMRIEPIKDLDCNDGTPETVPVYSNCICMSNFINSIRPPLSNFDIYSQ